MCALVRAPQPFLSRLCKVCYHLGSRCVKIIPVSLIPFCTTPTHPYQTSDVERLTLRRIKGAGRRRYVKRSFQPLDRKCLLHPTLHLCNKAESSNNVAWSTYPQNSFAGRVDRASEKSTCCLQSVYTLSTRCLHAVYTPSIPYPHTVHKVSTNVYKV